MDILAERESIYRLLPQTTPSSLAKNLSAYTLDPRSRYPSVDLDAVRVDQVRHLIETDNPRALFDWLEPNTRAHGQITRHTPLALHHRFAARPPTTFSSMFDEQARVLRFCAAAVGGGAYKVSVVNFGRSWRDGRALCALVHRFKADLLDYTSLDVSEVAANRRLAFALIEREFGKRVSVRVVTMPLV
jgi:hypothetical protein